MQAEQLFKCYEKTLYSLFSDIPLTGGDIAEYRRFHELQSGSPLPGL